MAREACSLRREPRDYCLEVPKYCQRLARVIHHEPEIEMRNNILPDGVVSLLRGRLCRDTYALALVEAAFFGSDPLRPWVF